MTRLFLLPAFTVVLLAGACAPAPLYTSSGLQRGAVTWGEIPRDARGEPVWTAIRPLQPDVSQAAAGGRSSQPEAAAEGDAEVSPTPPTA